MLHLHITFPDASKKQLDLSTVPLPLRIGRDNGDAHVKIPDPYLSKEHCALFKRGDKFYIEDRGSSNGTFLNGVKIEESHLEDMDNITIGISEMQIVDDGLEAADPFIGRSINGYVLETKIGQGNQAAVYLSRLNPLNKAVALKIIEVEKWDATKVAYFDNESYQISKLNHEHIIRAYDFFEEKGLHVIVMGLLSGDDILNIMRHKDVAFTVKECLRFLIQIGDAIGHLKEIGVVHRDIKPANVIVSDKGKYVLTDFGLAKDIRGTRAPTPGRIAGTPLYMSPEQIIGKNVDHRADIYSLGASVWHMLTGQPLYSGSNTDVLKAHLSKPVPDLAAVTANLHSDVIQLVSHMLAKSPADRPPSGLVVSQRARDILAALSHAGKAQQEVAKAKRQVGGSGTRRIVKTRV